MLLMGLCVCTVKIINFGSHYVRHVPDEEIVLDVIALWVEQPWMMVPQQLSIRALYLTKTIRGEPFINGSYNYKGSL